MPGLKYLSTVADKEAQQHKRDKDVASDVFLSCSCYCWAGSEEKKRETQIERERELV